MKLDYGLLVLALGLVYGVLVKFFPDFPISQEVLLSFAVFVLLQLGVEVVGAPLRSWLVARGFKADK